jgi:hypothetical protein
MGEKDQFPNQKPGTWFALYAAASIVPALLLLVLVLAPAGALRVAFEDVLRYGLVLWFALGMYVVAVGHGIYLGHRFDAWEYVQGIVIAVFLLGAIGATIRFLYAAPSPIPVHWGVMHLVVLCVVLFLCASITHDVVERVRGFCVQAMEDRVEECKQAQERAAASQRRSEAMLQGLNGALDTAAAEVTKASEENQKAAAGFDKALAEIKRMRPKKGAGT